MNNNNKEEGKILVTGATGTVGSEVVKRLVAIFNENAVRAAVHSKNNVDKIREFTNKGVEFVELDYTKPETITNALSHVDKLYLQTLPIPEIIDICSTIVKEAKKNGVNHIVKLSAMGADPESRTTILRLHGEEEEIIKESGIPYTFLRPPAFMQNFITQFGQTIKSQNAFYVPAGDAKMSFVDARDIAAVSAVILMNSGTQYFNKAYDITGQDALSYGQAAEILSNAVGRNVVYVGITEDIAKKGLKQIGMNDWFIDIMMELFRTIRGGYGSETTEVVEDITGRKPISFEQFAKDYADGFR
ncbi:MAG TPA: SDR family oxidoreductase [Nitrososphaeraceae archaeon]|nr:SDR family oxidoreductase [Nitrososphaeraceae archaeon]